MRSRLRQLEFPKWAGLDLLNQEADFVPLNKYGRAFSFSHTIKTVLKKRIPLGLTRINYLTPVNQISLPVFSITRPNVHIAQITATQGKGFSIREALASGLMESVERDAGSNFKNFTQATYHELNNINKPYVPLEMLGYNATPYDQIDWVKAINLYTANSVLVPACEVVFPYEFPSKSPKLNHPSTTGLSAGNTNLEAIVYGIFEVSERHAVSMFLEGKPFCALNWQAIDIPEIQTLFAHLERIGAQWCIIDLSHLSPFPCYFVSLLYLDTHTPPVMVAGQGCHLSPKIALKRALSEAIQSHTVAVQGNREDLINNKSEWEDNEDDVIESWHQAKIEAETNGLSVLPDEEAPPQNVYELCLLACTLLEEHRYQNILVTNLNSPAINIPVMHVLVPGMVDHTSNEQQKVPPSPAPIY